MSSLLLAILLVVYVYFVYLIGTIGGRLALYESVLSSPPSPTDRTPFLMLGSIFVEPNKQNCLTSNVSCFDDTDCLQICQRTIYEISLPTCEHGLCQIVTDNTNNACIQRNGCMSVIVGNTLGNTAFWDCVPLDVAFVNPGCTVRRKGVCSHGTLTDRDYSLSVLTADDCKSDFPVVAITSIGGQNTIPITLPFDEAFAFRIISRNDDIFTK